MRNVNIQQWIVKLLPTTATFNSIIPSLTHVIPRRNIKNVKSNKARGAQQP